MIYNQEMKAMINDNAKDEKLFKVEELYGHVKRYRLHSALASLGVVGMKIIKNDPSIGMIYPRSINEFQMAFLAKALILNSNDHRREDFGDKGLFASANYFNNLSEKLMSVSEVASNEEKLKETQSFLIRLANQQFPFQVGIKHLIPRATYLFDEIPNSLNKPEFDVPGEIKAMYGLTPRELLVIGFCIFAKSDNGYFNPDHLIYSEIPKLKSFLTRDKVMSLVSSLTTNYNKLRELFRANVGEEGLEQYAFNPLRSYPLVETQVAGLVIPVPRFLVERITTGLFYSLMEKHSKAKANNFLEFFGKEIFERYVGLLLSSVYNSKHLLKEWEYGSSHDRRRTSDWIILLGEVAILVECKTSGITKEAKSWAEKITVQESLRKHVIRGILQMQRLENDVKSDAIGLGRFKGVKKFYRLVVTFDRIFLSGTPIIRDLIDADLVKSGSEIRDYQILSVDELEKLIPVVPIISTENLIDAKLSKREWFEQDFDVFMANYCKEKGVDYYSLENQMLEKRFHDFFDFTPVG